MAFLLGALLVVLWPVHPGGQNPIEFSVAATGVKDPRSQASEVWILQLPREIDRQSLLASAVPQDSWKVDGQRLIASGSPPSSIRWAGFLAPGSVIEFLQHDWSGFAQITVNGRTLDLNLFDPQSSRFVLRLDEYVSASEPGNNYFPLLSTALLLSLVFAPLIVGVRALRATSAARSVPAARAWDILLFALPGLLVFFLTMLGTWPAQMSYDSVDQWHQIIAGVLHNNHPVVQTLLFGGFGYLAGTPAATIFFQIVLLALAIGGVLSELGRWGVPRWALWVMAVLLPLFPPVHLLATVFWKDIAYAIALLMLSWVVLILLRTRGKTSHGLLLGVAFCAAAFAVGAFRHNGFIVATGVAAALILAGRRWLRAPFMLAALASSLVLPLLLTFVLVPALKIPNPPRQYVGIGPIHALGRLVAEDKIVDPGLKERLRTILPLERWRDLYDCYNVSALFWAEGINYDPIDATLYRSLGSEFLHHPAEILQHYACVTSLLWRISPAPVAFMPLDIQRPPGGLLRVAYEPVPQIDRLLKTEAYYTREDPWLHTLVWRPATQVFALLCLCLIAVNRRNAATLLVAISPVAMNVVSLAPFIGAQDYRYQLGAVMAAIVLSVLLLFGGDLRSSGEARGAVRGR